MNWHDGCYASNMMSLTDATFGQALFATDLPFLVVLGRGDSSDTLEVMAATCFISETVGGIHTAYLDPASGSVLTRKFGIDGLPTIMLFLEGRECCRISGKHPRSWWLQEIGARLDAVARQGGRCRGPNA